MTAGRSPLWLLVIALWLPGSAWPQQAARPPTVAILGPGAPPAATADCMADKQPRTVACMLDSLRTLGDVGGRKRPALFIGGKDGVIDRGVAVADVFDKEGAGDVGVKAVETGAVVDQQGVTRLQDGIARNPMWVGGIAPGQNDGFKGKPVRPAREHPGFQ